MTDREALMAAMQLLNDRAKWTTRQLARDGAGVPVDPTSPLAARWCAVGALCKVTDTPSGRVPIRGRVLLLQEAALEVTGHRIWEVNDTLGLDRVRQVYARAIELAEQEA